MPIGGSAIEWQTVREYPTIQPSANISILTKRIEAIAVMDNVNTRDCETHLSSSHIEE